MEPMLVDDDAQTCDHYQMQDHQRMDAEVKNAFLPSWWEQDPSEIRLFNTLLTIINGDRRLDNSFSKNFESVPEIVWKTLREVWKTVEFRKVRILRCIQHPESEYTYDHYQTQEHKRMDAEAKEALPASWWEHDPSEMRLLVALQKIIKGDDKLDDSFSEDHETVPEIVWTTLREVWKTVEFRRVRILRCIQAPETIVSYPLPALNLAKEMAQAYEGNSVKAFAEYLKTNESAYRNAEPRYYGRFCSITQSSGTGKTRLLLELGKNICVLYINIRPLKDTKGYPPRDHIPADILTADLYTEEEYAFQCQIFFATVFKCIGAFLQEGNSFTVLSDIHSGMRTTFFESVQKAFSEVAEEMRTWPNDVIKAYLRTMVKAAKVNEHWPWVIIALDESHVLHEKLKRPYVPATVLLRTISEFSEDESLWVVFASTVSKVADFAPSRTVYPSARVASAGEKLFPPFTLLGWDQRAPALKNVVLDRVALASHLLQYGRPLWWSLRSDGIDKIMRLAKEKLCASVTFDSSDKHQTFAVLGQRFDLEIAFGHREAIEYNDQLIANHLRICIKTTEDRERSYTTYPPEPFLSVAAAELLHADENNLAKALGVVSSFVNTGLINAGDSGDLVSRFIWLLAKDHCVHKGSVVPSLNASDVVQGDYELPYGQLVPVVTFLEEVFGPGVTERAPGIKTTFSDGYVNFNHWIRMRYNITRGEGNKNDATIEEWTESLWARTSAVQCCQNQPGIDKVIPIFFKSQPRGKSMSHILISDKARERSPLTTLMDISRHKITPADCSALPYIVILSGLGVDVDSEDERLNVFEEKGDQPGDHCFRIHALGLDSKTFTFLEPSIAEDLRDLYTRQDVQDAPPGSTSVEKELENQVQFGKSRERCYLNWKA